MKPAISTALILAALQAPAFAQSQPYLDDRSTPQALLQSLYNAINRKEYARAYDYFATPPAASLDAYQEGYADTEHVELVTGTASSEGAAGSSIYSLPVAIRAHASDGSERVFAGCYTLRLSDPQIQGSPYKPLQIENAEMKSASGTLRDVLPASCGDGSPDGGRPRFGQGPSAFLVPLWACLSPGAGTGRKRAGRELHDPVQLFP
ncbi:hypothetical protein AB2N04_13175 [Nitratireductor sp. GISD-1A_MAKvit]|uniref:hypothetical protein n=1 Tax=Nitratireductor sp. GISD-1A_MAKvit TaxID=3234198 RepID=UPI0034670671